MYIIDKLAKAPSAAKTYELFLDLDELAIAESPAGYFIGSIHLWRDCLLIQRAVSSGFCLFFYFSFNRDNFLVVCGRIFVVEAGVK